MCLKVCIDVYTLEEAVTVQLLRVCVCVCACVCVRECIYVYIYLGRVGDRSASA